MTSGRERGQATVELALCLPLLALLLGTVVEIGGLASDRVRLWHSAREAARVAAVDEDEAAVRAAARRSGLRDLQVTVRPDALERIQGRPVIVSLRYRPPGRVPLLGAVFRRIVLKAETTTRIEQA